MEILNKFWEYSTFKEIYIFRAMLWSICKQILFRTMAMKIHIKLYTFKMFLPNIKRKLMKTGNFRKNEAIKISKLPIQVLTRITSPIIAYNNPIRINHWDNIHNKHISNNIILWLVF